MDFLFWDLKFSKAWSMPLNFTVGKPESKLNLLNNRFLVRFWLGLKIGLLLSRLWKRMEIISSVCLKFHLFVNLIMVWIKDSNNGLDAKCLDPPYPKANREDHLRIIWPASWTAKQYESDQSFFPFQLLKLCKLIDSLWRHTWIGLFI